MEGKLADYRKAEAAKQRMRAARESLAPRLSRVLESYPAAQTAEEKNALLRSVLKSVVYNKTVRTRWGAESDMNLTLMPLLPDSY
ncbi:hypothetical protein SDC9_206543 [bioreactor metagenome]|uniref:Uncharacterized protein n=1 Tax=bioreactor metagenome TaxID=1076179 RepID=A0A645J5A6_9ZZZZ